MTQDNNDKNNDEISANPPSQEAPKAAAPLGGRNKSGRFEKGFTGNAKGRPKKSERAFSNRQLMDDVLLEANALVPVARNGTTDFVPMHRLIMRRIFVQALNGNIRAQKMALDYISRAQSGKETLDWSFYKDLENVEKSHDEVVKVFSEKVALEHRDNWRKRSRKV